MRGQCTPNRWQSKRGRVSRGKTAAHPLVGALAAIAIVSGSLAAQEAEEKRVIEPQAVTTDDGWKIHLTYYQSTVGRDAPVVLLLHGKGGNRLVWEVGPDMKAESAFAYKLQSEGYAVITADLRKHGASKAADDSGGKQRAGDDVRPNDYALMAAKDLEAIKEFLYQEHQAQHLNMRKLGIVAADSIAPVALNFAVADWSKLPWPDAPSLAARTPRGQDVRAIVLLSPTVSAGPLTSTRAANYLKNPALDIAFLVTGGSQDKFDKGAARDLYQQLSGAAKGEETKRMYFQELKDIPLRGTDLLGRKLGVEELMLAFFKMHLKELNDPWQDRKSRLAN